MSQSDLAIHALRELVDAIDRRVAHVERPGEARIAREAAGLRQEAVQRIQELTTERAADRPARDRERADGVTTDEGGPPAEDG